MYLKQVLSSWIRTKVNQFLIYGVVYQILQKAKVKEKPKVGTTSVIKKKYFHSCCQMNDFSCHHKSIKVHSIIALNACRRFVSLRTPLSNKNKPTGLENPNNSIWDMQNFMEKIERLSFTIDKKTFQTRHGLSQTLNLIIRGFIL